MKILKINPAGAGFIFAVITTFIFLFELFSPRAGFALAEDRCGSLGVCFCSQDVVYRLQQCWGANCIEGECWEAGYFKNIRVEDCAKKGQVCEGGECAAKKQPCQCSEGVCCDGCYFKTESAICDTQKIEQYACPWGDNCGDDVGRRVMLNYRYCSGESEDCSGAWSGWSGWSLWLKADDCLNSEVCSAGEPSCLEVEQCPQALSASGEQSGHSDNNSSNSGGACQGKDCPEQKKEINSGVKGLAYLGAIGLKNLLTSVFFWILTVVIAFTLLFMKLFKFTDWWGQKKLKRLSQTYR